MLFVELLLVRLVPVVFMFARLVLVMFMLAKFVLELLFEGFVLELLLGRFVVGRFLSETRTSWDRPKSTRRS